MDPLPVTVNRMYKCNDETGACPVCGCDSNGQIY